ncbi:bifunctional phosphopantothenoylcysteine decarboxylase/phosphopantothenate--cysteine ligase CoaBC [Weissella diestrammenae]|uniref:Coenzyme A biosynthesis bifunctional protein CoaBC n=1 Tax=Weissella diestrammenae TaxID=1162633 RepID=A0A7G9T7G8_9LACO|nr:bifunctional phosphopantothenoylcysteine decarboxylase/phosphopantothenate--cysteine ligase CoaBC [Weissella diestrammenae]MCM0582347.1 bifunctional phosphopantothenoylcysteine decarboxylase/phosphopantothenate--cysteine ligase CoaBC [Weissella diestrammenae]QNN76043.1 bifunctional phosphopantothenoylcysteine decarboxylase/phosphopantothenate--cysteine ligase CoaBC [Weissella diestrammenae]
MFKDKKVILIVTGGIAAYKAVIFARLLMKRGAFVRVVMTRSATEFVTPKTFATLTNQPVLTQLFSDTPDVPHIALADWADLMFVVPATANIIGKIANGIADDAASTVLLARHTPLVIAPAMNEHMYQNPAVQRNLDRLSADGVLIVAPVTGLLAEGYLGQGRLPEPEDILTVAEMQLQQLTHHALNGKHFIVTAGGTKEAIDPVRYITNYSSGKMGYSLAQALVENGATVTLISTVDDLKLPFGVKYIAVSSAEEMRNAVELAFDQSDGLIMAAAVADYRPENVAQQKIKKQTHDPMTMTLIQNPDIVAMMGAKKAKQIVVAFAAETQDLLKNAKAKLLKKNADMLIANDVTAVDAGFGVDTNRVTILQKDGDSISLPVMSKIEVARQIVEHMIINMTKE